MPKKDQPNQVANQSNQVANQSNQVANQSNQVANQPMVPNQPNMVANQLTQVPNQQAYYQNPYYYPYYNPYYQVQYPYPYPVQGTGTEALNPYGFPLPPGGPLSSVGSSGPPLGIPTVQAVTGPPVGMPTVQAIAGQTIGMPVGMQQVPSQPGFQPLGQPTAQPAVQPSTQPTRVQGKPPGETLDLPASQVELSPQILLQSNNNTVQTSQSLPSVPVSLPASQVQLPPQIFTSLNQTTVPIEHSRPDGFLFPSHTPSYQSQGIPSDAPFQTAFASQTADSASMTSSSSDMRKKKSNASPTKDSLPESESSRPDKNTESLNLSRHVTTVISHFSSAKDGYQRLMSEMDDYLMVMSPSGSVLYASPSAKKSLYASQESVDEMVHPDDLTLVKDRILSTLSMEKEHAFYCRYLKKGGGIVLVHVRCRCYVQDSSNESQKFVILAARDYTSRSAASIDAVIELKLENMRLKRALENKLAQLGMPTSHPLLTNDILSIPEEVKKVEEEEEDVDFFGDRFQGGLSQPNFPGLPQPGFSGYNPVFQAPGFPGFPQGFNPGFSSEVQEVPDKEKKKRKRTVPTDLFCRQCGTTTSCEWRKGPEGPKTLCNACGLAFSKKNRKVTTA